MLETFNFLYDVCLRFGTCWKGQMPTAKMMQRLLFTFVLAISSATIITPNVTPFAGPAMAINVVPLTVRTPHAGFNRMVVSVTVCDPDGRNVEVSFTIGDYRDALDRRVGAWDGFAEAADGSSRAFVWGAPFFLGRRVALVFAGKTTGDGKDAPGPFYALP